MKLTSKIQYGLKIALCVAQKLEEGEPVSISDIALAEQIPFNYTSLLARKLKCAKILESHRGAQGGYTLARAPEQITITDILTALDDFQGFLPADLLPDAEDPSPDECFWIYLNRSMQSMMDTITLAVLLKTTSEQDIDAVIRRSICSAEVPLDDLKS